MNSDEIDYEVREDRSGYLYVYESEDDFFGMPLSRCLDCPEFIGGIDKNGNFHFGEIRWYIGTGYHYKTGYTLEYPVRVRFKR